MYWIHFDKLRLGCTIGDGHYGLDAVRIGGAIVEIKSRVSLQISDAHEVLDAMLRRVINHPVHTTNKLIYVLEEKYDGTLVVGWAYDGGTLYMAEITVTKEERE